MHLKTSRALKGNPDFINVQFIFRKKNVNRELLTTVLKNYFPADSEEKLFRVQFLDLLLHPNAYQRNHLPGHITGSAWIVDPSKKFVLLTHHAKLNKWLQPGGHADGDENILNVALREAREETGLTVFELLHDGLFDIDIHTIPARKEFQEHLHYDIRFLFQTDKNQPLLVTEESHALEWIPLDRLETITESNSSIIRMAEKVKDLF